MTQIIVGTDPVTLGQATGRGRPVIQNLGPGDVYFDSEATVTVATGLRLTPGMAFEFATAVSLESGLSIISDTTGNDVRVIVMGA